MSAYYNEIDPFAAAWLRELIAAGHIAPGFVDERDIRDVRPDELMGYTQCHFFAGIGGWPLALRQAGWPDNRPVWSGSCPCPPFSAAGPNFRCPECDTPSPVPNAVRTGAFNCIRCDYEWQADERHLFPEFYRLIRDRRPECIVGEQVASKDGRTWIDIVRASLEMLGYAIGHPDVCAAGFGSPNIRQRLFWVANAECADVRGEGSGSSAGASCGMQGTDGQRERLWLDAGASGAAVAIWLADPANFRHQRHREAWDGRVGPPNDCPACDGYGRCGPYFPGGLSTICGNCRLGNPELSTSQRQREHGGSLVSFEKAEGPGLPSVPACGLGDTNDAGLAFGSRQAVGCGVVRDEGQATPAPGPVNGFWSDAQWIWCSDERWRPTEPGVAALANGVSARVGRLRGYGNAINAEVATGFIEAVMDHLAAADRIAA